jgi:hypothetical protein
MSGDSYDFAVFAEDGKGPMWRHAFSELEPAKAKAKELADQEGLEFFVFSCKDCSEIARFFPSSRGRNAA